MKKIALVLSGSGFKDGAEITEAVSSIIALSEAGAEVHAFAPDVEFESSNHIDDSSTGSRNVMTEASRITRGSIRPLTELKVGDFEGIVFPGGYGAAKHLCTFATQGANCEVLLSAKNIIEEFHAASKPIAALCIAPALVAKVLGQHGVTVTIGNDKDTAAEIEKTGAQHEDCVVDDYITDRLNKVVTSPAYMYGDAKPHLIYKGIQGAIKEFYEMA